MSSLNLRSCSYATQSLDSIQKEEILDRLAIMEHQDDTTYSCQDYLQLRDTIVHNKNEGLSGGCRSPVDCDYIVSMNDIDKKKYVNKICRAQICEWLYRVIDHFDIDREVVLNVISLLDRFMESHPSTTRRGFRMAATAALHIASKLCSGKTLKISFLVELSRGEFHTKHIVEMEQLILFTLNWHINPPNPLSFIEHFLAIVPPNTPHLLVQLIYEYSRFFAELFSCDYTCVGQKSCHIAIASLMNATEAIASNVFESNEWSEYREKIFLLAKLTRDDGHKIDILQDTMWNLFMSSEEYNSKASSHLSVYALEKLSKIPSKSSHRQDGGSSPVCVSFE